MGNFGKTVTGASRFVLYGKDTYNARKQPTVRDWAWGITQNLLRKSFGLHAVSAPGLIDFLRNQVTDWLMEWMQIGDDSLPDGWPKQVFKVIDEVVKARGGQVELSGGLKVPAFSLNPRTALVLPSMWISYVDLANESCDFEKIRKIETSIEDALTRRCKRDYNIRVMSKPARIEVDNPNPPTVRLSQHWDSFVRGAVPSGSYVLGIESKPEGDTVQYNLLRNANEFSIAYFGASGSGKTQALLSALLTVCATTSPSDLSVIVIDPKALDFPVDGLPHLVRPIITDAEEALRAVIDVVKEMDRRVQYKDRAAAQKRILLVIDELADLLQVQQGNELEAGLLRLAQKGRAWGFSMMIGSQRAVNESFPRNIHAQIPARWVGRVLNSSEAQFAAGMESDAHKLPGRGAAMIYEPSVSAVRIQSLFVADANSKEYAKLVKPFMDDISRRWAGKRAHWSGNMAEGQQVSNESEDDNPAPVQADVAVQEELLALLTKDQYDSLFVHTRTTNGLSMRKMREILGRRFSAQKESALYATLIAHFDLA